MLVLIRPVYYLCKRVPQGVHLIFASSVAGSCRTVLIFSRITMTLFSCVAPVDQNKKAHPSSCVSVVVAYVTHGGLPTVVDHGLRIRALHRLHDLQLQDSCDVLCSWGESHRIISHIELPCAFCASENVCVRPANLTAIRSAEFCRTSPSLSPRVYMALVHSSTTSCTLYYSYPPPCHYHAPFSALHCSQGTVLPTVGSDLEAIEAPDKASNNIFNTKTKLAASW